MLATASAALPAFAYPAVRDASAAAIRGPAVVLLWASWCAPCKSELGRIEAIAAAAAPLRVVTLALDPADEAAAELDRQGVSAIAYADARPPATVLAAWGGTALPLAVAIDARGMVCARKQGLLGTDQLRAWAKRCSR